jgi:hypothetical protein
MGASGPTRWKRRGGLRTRRRSKALEARLGGVRRGGKPTRRPTRGRPGGQGIRGERTDARKRGRAVTRPHGSGRDEGDLDETRRRRCRRGARLRRAGEHGEEARFATGPNAVNPRIGSGMQQAREVEEEKAVEVARNHEDGTRTRLVASSRRSGSDAGPGVDSPTDPDGGAFFGQPHERKPGSDAGRHGPGSRRKRRRQGHEGRARSSSPMNERPGRRSLEDPPVAKAARRRSRRAVVSTRSHDVDRTPFPRGGPPRCARRAAELVRGPPFGAGRRTAGPRRLGDGEPRGARKATRSQDRVRP